MSYDIPRNLNKYAEEFLFGLSLKKFIYAFSSLVLAFLIYISLSGILKPWAIALILLPVLTIGVLFTFFSLDDKIAAYFNLKRSLYGASYFDSSIESIIDVNKIEENAVYLKKGSMLAILELTPIDFFILSKDQKQQILSAYHSWLKSIDYYVQILSRSVNVDISTWCGSIQSKAGKTQARRAKAFVDWMDEELRTYHARDRRFYVIIPQKVVCKQKSAYQEFKSIFTGHFIDNDDPAALDAARLSLQANILNCQEMMEKCQIATRRLNTAELLGLYSSFFKNESTLNKSLLSPVMWMDQALQNISPPNKPENLLTAEIKLAKGDRLELDGLESDRLELDRLDILNKKGD